MKNYKIINLVKEDFNKAVVFYNISKDEVHKYFLKFKEYLSKNTESDLYANIIKNDSGNLIIQHNMACIDMLVDDSWWSDSDLSPVIDEILK